MKTALALFTFCLSVLAAHAADRISLLTPDASKCRDVRIAPMDDEDSLARIVREFTRALEPLAQKYLPAGTTLEIRFQDIDLAGNSTPMREANYRDVRVYDSLYPPRLQFTYRLLGASGEVLKEGQETLQDLNYQSITPRMNSDYLFYDKQLLTSWFRDAFSSK